jgi:CDP-diacylglycerol--glycerol-3-phosphate 3-phosphatidyltransferase
VQKAVWQERARSLLAPIVSLLARFGVTPTAVTLSGLALHVVCGVVIAAGHPVVGGFLLLFAAVADALDGALARQTGRASRFGAFLDSTVDRIDETVVLAGIAAYFLGRGGTADMVWAAAVLLALGGSLITSYTRARAEGLGLECTVGLFERPERIAVTLAGLFFGYWVLVLATLTLVTVSWYTVWQRIRHVHQVLQNETSGSMRPVPVREDPPLDIAQRLADLEPPVGPVGGPEPSDSPGLGTVPPSEPPPLREP